MEISLRKIGGVEEVAREGRQKSKSGIHHVLLRGVDKLFLNDADYGAFHLRMREHFCGEAKLLAYLLLPNRVHLLIKEGQTGPSAVIKPLCTSYARYFNRTYSAEGKLFYDRFKSVPAETKEEIADTVAFFNAIGECFADAANFSLAEYKNGGGVCDTEMLRGLIGAEVLGVQPKALHLDDYEQLTQREQAEYLRITAHRTAEEISAMDRQSEEFITLFSGRGATARKLMPIFGIKNALGAERQTRVKPIPAPEAETQIVPPKQEKAPEQRQKRDLSVWLL